MEYLEFLDYRKDVIAKSSELIDAGDLDFYGKFPRVTKELFQDPDDGGHKGTNIHRCHLVEDFLRFYGLDTGDNVIEKKLISYSLGVRQSLVVLMDLYLKRKWLIASDNYPYYQNLANTMKVSFDTFETIGKSGLESIAETTSDADVMLVTYPLKPSGQKYTPQDWKILRSWLAVSPERRLVLDTVYLFEIKDETELFSLFHETKQVVLLYSLSKAFASPHVAGFTFSYDESVREGFKAIERNDQMEEAMRLCYLLLNRDEGLRRYDEIRAFLQNHKVSAITAGLLPDTYDCEGYLFYVSGNAFEDLQEQGILTVHPGVYCSHADGVIVSTLSV